MSPRLLLTVAIITVIARGMAAQQQEQPTTADGVVALARGDYARAVEILRPLAEDWSKNDATAQFFMAGLYEAGRGVPADPLRACALYARAGSDSGNPFGREASSLFGQAVSAGGLEFDGDCQALSVVGFDTGFEPATFDLGPGHFVQWTLSAATVSYEGQTKRVDMPIAGIATPGSRVLPLRHTELATGRTRSVTRHFIEIFVWQPSPKSAHWTLRWHVYEVVRDDIIAVDVTDSLLTVSGVTPPPEGALDVRTYAVLRVDDEGNAEWAALNGPRPQSGEIPSDAERREVHDEKVAREAALERIDWTERLDVQRHPGMAYVDAAACGELQVYGWSTDRAEAVVVRARGSALGLSPQPATFDLALEAANIAIEAYVYAAPQRRFDFCSDVGIMPEIAPETWRAIAGTITIELSGRERRALTPYRRRATVTLSNVVLRNAAGRTTTITKRVRLTAIISGVSG